MNFEKILGKRQVKLLFLLISASLIMTASAAVYYALLMESDVTITEAAVYFTSGDDSTAADVSLGTNNTYAHLAGLKAYPNVTLTYEQAINITNTDESAHDISLRHISITPDSGDDSIGNFTSITFKLINTTGGVEATFEYTTTNDNWNPPDPTEWKSIPGSNTEWTIRIETVAVAGAKNNTSCGITITLDVQ